MSWWLPVRLVGEHERIRRFFVSEAQQSEEVCSWATWANCADCENGGRTDRKECRGRPWPYRRGLLESPRRPPQMFVSEDATVAIHRALLPGTARYRQN